MTCRSWMVRFLLAQARWTLRPALGLRSTRLIMFRMCILVPPYLVTTTIGGLCACWRLHGHCPDSIRVGGLLRQAEYVPRVSTFRAPQCPVPNLASPLPSSSQDWGAY